MSTIERLAKAISEVTELGKNQTNQAQGWKYRGVDDVVNVCGPALRRHGVVMLPAKHTLTTSEVEVRNGSAQHALLEVAYWFVSADGDPVTVSVSAEAIDYGDKAVAKAWSVALRTALLQVFCIPTGERDPDEDVYERQKPQSQKQRAVVKTGGRTGEVAAKKQEVVAFFDGDVAKAADWWREHGDDFLDAGVPLEVYVATL